MIEGGVTSGSREPLLLWGVLHLRRGEGGHLFEDGPVSIFLLLLSEKSKILGQIGGLPIFKGYRDKSK